MAVSSRVRKVSNELRKELSLILRTKVKNPRLSLVSIVEVEVSSDLSYAQVFFSLAEQKRFPQIVKDLEKSKGFFRKHIAKELKLRIVPNLKFIYDNSIEQGLIMDHVIQNALDEDKKLFNNSEEHLNKNYRGKKGDEDDFEILR